MVRENIDVMSCYKEVNIFFRKLRSLHFKLNLPLKQIWYGEWKKFKKVYDTIIIFDYVLEKDIIKYVEKKTDSRVIFWYWNSINRNSPKEFKSNRCEFWSFDKKDCKKYNLRYNNQFYFPITSKRKEILYDVSFVGMDKGRGKKLVELKKSLEERKVISKFIIVEDESSDRLYLDKHTVKESLQYDELIEIILQSRCLLDITKEKQSGITLRVLEAMFYSKKLITNNISILEYEFYDSENIFILGLDDISRIKQFINSPYKEVNNIIKKKYEYETWISNFERKKEDINTFIR